MKGGCLLSGGVLVSGSGGEGGLLQVVLWGWVRSYERQVSSFKFRVSVFGFWVSDVRFGVWGLGFGA